jgi:hypothetical protein
VVPLLGNSVLTYVGGAMGLSDAVIGLKAYKELDKRMKQLWHDIDQAIIGPRMDITRQSLPGIQVKGVSTTSIDHF